VAESLADRPRNLPQALFPRWLGKLVTGPLWLLSSEQAVLPSGNIGVGSCQPTGHVE